MGTIKNALFGDMDDKKYRELMYGNKSIAEIGNTIVRYKGESSGKYYYLLTSIIVSDTPLYEDKDTDKLYSGEVILKPSAILKDERHNLRGITPDGMVTEGCLNWGSDIVDWELEWCRGSGGKESLKRAKENHNTYRIQYFRNKEEKS